VKPKSEKTNQRSKLVKAKKADQLATETVNSGGKNNHAKRREWE